MIFSSFFETGSLPSVWRSAVVTPVFKKGVSSDVNNYRSISLTCCFCNIIESIVKDQMLDYLPRNKLISKNQHGFLARRSTCTQPVASPASGHVGTCPLAFERIFSLGYTLKEVVWFGLVLCQTLTQHYLFSRIRF